MQQAPFILSYITDMQTFAVSKQDQKLIGVGKRCVESGEPITFLAAIFRKRE